ncbi:MAG: beta-N-acetylhexosaminidase [Nitrospinota bacterium]|nr:MAG: beta-N-acetylhexosaminidase [Nitrospinota bacterium]
MKPDTVDLPLAQQVGQLFMLGFAGTEIPAEIETWITHRGLGGIILFRSNIDLPESVDHWSASAWESSIFGRLHRLATCTPRSIPFLMAIDQEGGQVSRLPPPFTQFPSPALLGQRRSTALVRRIAHMMARELRVAGINMNLAPVLDVNTNPENPVIGSRSFSPDPSLVSSLGVAFIKALQGQGVIATAKHFPGHGDTSLDSHLTLPVVPHDRERLSRVELVPFSAAIRAGVESVMTAHVLYPQLDPLFPATLSRSILEGLLREGCGFGGVIITDDLSMQAITKHYSLGEAALLAFQAGADLLLISRDSEQQWEAYQAILTAVQQGKISLARLSQSVRRVLALKRRFPLPPFSPQRLVEFVTTQQADQALIAEILQQEPQERL